jgi:competence protein ComEA
MAKNGFAKEYFSFTKKDRIAAFIIAGLMLIIYLLPSLLPARSSDLIVADSLFLQPADSVLAAQANSWSDKEEPSSYEKQDVSVFNFDPNTLSATGWSSLGLRPKTISTIQNYLSKGGRFRKAEDLAKIWGLPPGFYERVKDHIVITKAEDAAPKQFTNNYQSYNRTREPEVISANHADSISFTALRGIGEKLAGRIIAFREKLGGFYSVEQIGETYGLPDSTFQKIKPQLNVDGVVKKININSATKEQLKDHPYFRWKLANTIVEYRNQHGNFTSIEDLKKIVLVDEKTFEKIRHYLEL